MPEDLKLEQEIEKTAESRRGAPFNQYLSDLRYYITLCRQLRAERDRLKKEMEWVPVSEKLPPLTDHTRKEKHYILACDAKGRMAVAFCLDNEHWVSGKAIGAITHWRALPTPPAEREE